MWGMSCPGDASGKAGPDGGFVQVFEARCGRERQHVLASPDVAVETRDMLLVPGVDDDGHGVTEDVANVAGTAARSERRNWLCPLRLAFPDSTVRSRGGGFGNAQECSVEQGGIYDDGHGGRARRLAAEAYRLTSARDARQSLRAVLPIAGRPACRADQGITVTCARCQVRAIRHT